MAAQWRAKGGRLSKGGRLGIVGVLVLAAAVGIFFAVRTLTWWPSTVSFQPGADGAVHVTLQTVGSIGYGNHPTWVSYMLEDPSGHWQHTTVFQVPAHTRIDV